MRAAAVQINSTQDRSRNLATAGRLVRQAAGDGAQTILLPERFDLRGTPADYEAAAAPLDSHPTVEWTRDLARELGIDLIAGSLSERREGRDKLSNTAVHAGPDGDLRGIYRKIHLFDVTVGETDYLESESDEGGNEIVVSELADATRLGLSVCYDVRFPELYRIQAVQGARVLTVPANFTHVTGTAHWEVLLRARAVENQAFVVAAAQIGTHPPDLGLTYGNSMIVDPWGEVLARAGDSEETYVIAELDFARQDDVRAKLPSLANRAGAAYRWPVEATA